MVDLMADAKALGPRMYPPSKKDLLRAARQLHVAQVTMEGCHHSAHGVTTISHEDECGTPVFWIAISDDIEDHEQLFALAHEIGHVLGAYGYRGNSEEECDEFASRLVAPVMAGFNGPAVRLPARRHQGQIGYYASTPAPREGYG